MKVLSGKVTFEQVLEQVKEIKRLKTCNKESYEAGKIDKMSYNVKRGFLNGLIACYNKKIVEAK